MYWGNLNHLSSHDQLKFVISDRSDYTYAREVANRKPPQLAWDHMLFSPVQGALPPRELARWILEDGLAVRLHLQLHAIIWPDAERGV
jgi:7-carboxy-7-deazaguanine synthase